MANIFLSYDRDDEARAQPIAAALERAGHSVWWDRRIKGGGEFGAEIEAALDAADKVVVLWSDRAIKSAWVRDEAASGRDSGRLVPATLDGTLPPLGFRQFQTIDLSRSKGRRPSPQIQALLEAVATPGRVTASSPPKLPKRPLFSPGRPILLAGAALVLIVAAAGTWLWRSGTAGEPRITIVAADGSLLSRQVAHDLALALPNLPGGNASGYELVDATDNSSEKADLVLTTGASSSRGHERRDLALHASNGAILWSATIDQPTAAAAINLPQQLAVRAERAFRCLAEAQSYRRESIRQDMLKLYLAGCTASDSAYDSNVDNSQQIHLFEQVLAKAPHFEPAWAKLFEAEIDEVENVDDPSSMRRKIAAQIGQAQKLGLDFGELYAAKAAIISPVDFLGIFRAYNEGLKRHPDNATLFKLRGIKLMFVGRMNDSVGDSTRAVELDPLSPAKQQSLASAYAYAGNSEAGYAQLKRAEQLWPQAPTVISARFRLDLRYGDPKEALALLQDPIEQGPLQSEQAAFIKARIDPSPENIERSIAEDQKIYQQYPAFISQIVQTLAQFGRKDEVLNILLHYTGGDQSGLAAEVLFRPALRDVWRDPRSMAAAAHLGLLHYWKVSGNWPDYCSDPSLPYDCKKEAAKYPV